ncbi:ATP-grasp domain-containing protein [Flavobacterium sp. NG2]|uniref:ATP-grasp domain-containing protein n=1 Tax=Flavobacterium sp. NG2 TaxID=3097547 RepID=UPI002A8135C8|nr:ATP-grasp domain-containing protein [Flavobacterium sp. NG2]WPR71619.1 ATP-grasp domain-containing protein [Flavobacterium sp. NG2]
MSKKNILVFPCGSEVALEIYRSLEHSIHFNIIGGNSIDDHGKFVFEQYIGNIPFVTDDLFIESLKKIVVEYNIDAIYPAMDLVLHKLKENEEELGCKVISSDIDTTSICLSKSKTYEKFKSLIQVPEVFQTIESIQTYPVFLKPDVGYGSRGVLKANNSNEVHNHIVKHPNALILEYLPGKEFTIDCFTNFKGELLFAGARERSRIANGISVHTKTMALDERFHSIALIINATLELNGAWFFQLKENKQGELVLLEIASRIGGSSAVYKAKGINFAALSLFNAFELPVSILENDFEVEMDRALNNIFKIAIEFNHVYVDLDDTIIVDNKINYNLVATLYKFINEGKQIHLITKHQFNLAETLLNYKIDRLFDSIIHLKREDNKFEHIKYTDAIFIDDSFQERKDVLDKLKIPVFGIDLSFK